MRSDRRVTLAVLAATAGGLITATAASAAVQAGAYAGTSQNTVFTRYGQQTPQVQKGTVAFRVSATRASGFRLRGQRAQCPGTAGAPVIDVTIPSLPLSPAGVARGQIVNPTFGPITVTVRVAANGTARGTVAYLPQCGRVTPFTAKRR